MNLYLSTLWETDLDNVLEILPELHELEGHSVLITGIGGLIGSAVADLLLRYNRLSANPIIIYAAARSEDKILARFGHHSEQRWFHFVPYEATATLAAFPSEISFIIHGAGNASPDRFMKEPVETMVSNFVGLKNLFDYGKSHGCKRLLYISSSEVYGKNENDRPYTENEYGYIDLLNVRNSYSVGKRAAETLCTSYASEYGVDSVIVRPGHVYGPTASKSDHRVSSEWPYAVSRGKDIIMKSDGAQIRSYCYCLDCASAILKVLLRGESGHAYNISNPDSVITVRQMAELLTQSADVNLRIELPTETEKHAFNPMNNSSLTSDRLQALGWSGCFDAKTGFSHTVRIIRECEGAEI